MKLVITLATRGRPEQVVDTIQRSTKNLVLPNTVFMVQVDEDDTDTIYALGKAELDKRVVFNVAPREDTIAQKWNRALREDGDAYLVAADDDPYVTPGYDQRLLDGASLFPDGIGIVYGHLANASFTGAVCPTRKWVDQLGWIFPEHFPYWFVDHWTHDLATITGRISLADVRTDQSNVGKTQEMREPGWWASWFDAAYMVRREQAYKIIDALDEPKWRKDMQKNSAPMTEYRSKAINDNVRRNDKAYSEWSGLGTNDERYRRLRDKAVEMIPDLLKTLKPHEAAHYKKQLLMPRVIEAAWDHDGEKMAQYIKWLS